MGAGTRPRALGPLTVQAAGPGRTADVSLAWLIQAFSAESKLPAPSQDSNSSTLLGIS